MLGLGLSFVQLKILCCKGMLNQTDQSCGYNVQWVSEYKRSPFWKPLLSEYQDDSIGKYLSLRDCVHMMQPSFQNGEKYDENSTFFCHILKTVDFENRTLTGTARFVGGIVWTLENDENWKFSAFSE